jgi:carboxymethylenebutenolidase
MLVLMEIFGVTGYIREAADRLASAGYVSLAPDLYRRTRPGAEFPHTEDGLPKAFEAVQALDIAGAVEDAITALHHLENLPETIGPVGVLGFCLGGTLAYGVAVHGDPATSVCYYGSGIPDMLGEAGQVTGPVLFHFGGADPYIPREHSEKVAATAAKRDGWAVHIHENAGHAFDNWDAPMFSQPEPAAQAWEHTKTFLRTTLPAG